VSERFLFLVSERFIASAKLWQIVFYERDENRGIMVMMPFVCSFMCLSFTRYSYVHFCAMQYYQISFSSIEPFLVLPPFPPSISPSPPPFIPWLYDFDINDNAWVLFTNSVRAV
jgi:hypothetical protein